MWPPSAAGSPPRSRALKRPSQARAPRAPVGLLGALPPPWHFLNFLPEPHQQGSLRPSLAAWAGAWLPSTASSPRWRRTWPGRRVPSPGSRAPSVPAAPVPLAEAAPAGCAASRGGRGRRSCRDRCRRGVPGRSVAAASVRRGRGSADLGQLGGRRHAHLLGRRRLLPLDADPEDRAGDLVADEAPQLLVQLERLALELVERVRAAVAAQADAAAEVVELGEVVHPQRVDRAQQDQALDHGPDVGAVLLLPRLELRVGGVVERLDDAFAAALPRQALGIDVGPFDAHRQHGSAPAPRCPIRR